MGVKGVREISIDLKDLYDPSRVPSIVQRGLFNSNAEHYEAIAKTRSTYVGKNLATISVYLYQALFGGVVTPHGPQQGNSSPGKDRYHPDVIHTYRAPPGRVDVEVKSFNTNGNGKAMCRASQFERYAAKLLGRLSGRSYSLGRTSFNYAFFRYSSPAERILQKGTYSDGRKKSKKEPLTRLAGVSRREFLDFIGQNIGDLLVVPPNLLTLLFANANSYHHSDPRQEFSSKPSRHVRGGDITKLRKLADESKGIESLLEHHHRSHELPPGVDDEHVIGALKPEELMLDSLRAVQEESPRIIINGKHEVKPFPYTVYEFKSDKDLACWNRFLIERSEDVLVRTLEVRDLHREFAPI